MLLEGSLTKRALGSRAAQSLHLGRHPWHRATSALRARGWDLKPRLRSRPDFPGQPAGSTLMHDAGTLSGWRMRPLRSDLPHSRFLRLGQCHHFTGMDTVGSSGRESDGRRPSLSSPSSPAWEGEAGRTLQQRVRAPQGGRGGPGRGAAIPPRACPARGCSRLESGCLHPQNPEKAPVLPRVVPAAPGQKQAETEA